MSESTNIEWAQHTGGPYLGCSKVSPGCSNCYAWVLMLQRLAAILRKAYRLAGFADWETRPVWGDNAPRVLSKGFWSDVRRINKQHEKSGTRGRWFPSMIDWLDTMPAGIIDQDGNKLDPAKVLADFVELAIECKHLDFLLLTKRPENFFPLLQTVWRMNAYTQTGQRVADWVENNNPPENIWLGVSVEDQKRADERLPLLAQIPARIRFASFEPLLEYVNPKIPVLKQATEGVDAVVGLDWAIIGGESGPNRRDCGVEAICDLADDISFTNGIATFVKQDCAARPGQQGRIPDDVWALKEFPKL